MKDEFVGVSGINVLVHDYEEAMSFYCDKLGFTVMEHLELGAGAKWIKLNPSSNQGQLGIILSKAQTPQQQALVGKQASDSVLMILQTNDFEFSYQRMQNNGIEFLEQPRIEPYGTVVIFKDLYGNKWDLIQSI